MAPRRKVYSADQLTGIIDNIMAPPIDKALEIALLQYLGRSSSYFADYFSKDDIGMMCSNIRSDFGIETGTSIEALHEQIRDANRNMAIAENQVSQISEELESANRIVCGLNNRINEIFLNLIDENADRDNQDVPPISAVHELFDMKTIIRTKIERGHALTTNELSYVSANI